MICWDYTYKYNFAFASLPNFRVNAFEWIYKRILYLKQNRIVRNFNVEAIMNDSNHDLIRLTNCLRWLQRPSFMNIKICFEWFHELETVQIHNSGLFEQPQVLLVCFAQSKILESVISSVVAGAGSPSSFSFELTALRSMRAEVASSKLVF